MNKSDLQRYKNTLLEMRERLIDNIGRMAETVQTDAKAVGEHDRAVSEAIDKELLLETTEEGIQREVRDAIRRIEEGTYGLCQECGTTIAKSRLDAVPYTPYCINCERNREAG
jgi:DnaK suppressor protein